MKRKTKKCEICNKEISLSNFSKHINSRKCSNVVETVKEKNWFKNNDGEYVCKICGYISTKDGIGNHIKYHFGYENPFKGIKGRKIWNKGLTKETDERVKKNGESLSNNIKNGITIKKGCKHTKETKELLSKLRSLNNKGGRCKWYDVCGQMVQGTWERDLAIKMNELGITWIKNTNLTFEYFSVIKDRLCHYTPDFLIEEIDRILEVKGFWIGFDKEKMEIVIKAHKELQEKLIIIEKEFFKNLLMCKSKKEFYNLLLLPSS